MNPRVITQALTGNPLAAAVVAGNAPANWYEKLPAGGESWRQRLEAVRSDGDDDWLTRLAPAFDATGKAKARLEASAAGRGVVVTTGQQPGLFGGPTIGGAVCGPFAAAGGAGFAACFWPALGVLGGSASDGTEQRAAASSAEKTLRG